MGDRRGVVLALACAAQFMVVLDISVVNVALPSIQRSLGFGDAVQQWVVNAYALTFAGLLLLGGRLADLYGHRRVFLTGLALFSGASLAGGLAGTAELLVAARAVQGIGAAVLAPATLTVLTGTFAEGPRRTRALAMWTAVGVAGGTAGNLLGGILTEYLSWRSILLINVPVGAVALLLAPRHLAGHHRPAGRPRLDVTGAVLATLGLSALTFGIARSHTSGWAAPATVAALAVAAAALAAFVVVEARFAAVPVIPPRLFRARAISIGNLAMLLAGACLNPMWFFLTLAMQNVLHYSPLQTGLAFLPHTVVTIVVAARVTPWLMRHVGSRTLVALGSLLAAAGFAWQAQLTPDSGYLTGILGPAIVFSLGGGLLNTPLTTLVTSGVGPGDGGAASGLMNTTKQVGGAVGLAALVTLAGPGYATAFLAMAALMAVTAVVALTLPRGPVIRAGRGERRGRPAPPRNTARRPRCS
ncbi:DHA2 family efflux MFS transporter permease subunit [Amycolatopsis suaedae]|uniref:DHA2 family efflux MFS transporter permease subunit n=2 Tax=Amycolatopsis suaedae TaxID=2510978 RepID=A0A4V2ELH3_9PSEU|nr:DHA2 family efflux MFS transporter permease subunit [Amycolatopsis suaedae]